MSKSEAKRESKNDRATTFDPFTDHRVLTPQAKTTAQHQLSITSRPAFVLSTIYTIHRSLITVHRF
ncbi:MAG TPA: hypothetical protein VN496_13655 [Burkholderiales bacterium]|nr:hypothetical protein [Burkholderiales bacterium]